MRVHALRCFFVGLSLSLASATALAGTPKPAKPAPKPAPAPVAAPEAPAAPAPAPISLPFGPGERVEYKLVALGATAGHLKLGVVDEGELDGKQLMSLAAKLSPSPIIKMLWQGESRRTSFLDTQALRPVRAIDVEESPEKIYKTQVDFNASTVHTTRFGARPDGSDATSKRSVPTGTLETLSGIYQLRTRTMNVGDTFQLDIIDNGQLYVLSCKVTGSETIQTVLGEENALLIEIEARRPAPKRIVRPQPKTTTAQAPAEGITLAAASGPLPAPQAPATAPEEAPKPADITAKVWLSTSPDRVPLRFEVSIHKLGSMTAELADYTPAP